jgi:hypothetical protein
MITQLDTQLAIPLADSQFMAPTKAFPEGITAADRARLIPAYEAKTREIYAANTRLRELDAAIGQTHRLARAHEQRIAEGDAGALQAGADRRLALAHLQRDARDRAFAQDQVGCSQEADIDGRVDEREHAGPSAAQTSSPPDRITRGDERKTNSQGTQAPRAGMPAAQPSATSGSRSWYGHPTPSTEDFGKLTPDDRKMPSATSKLKAT